MHASSQRSSRVSGGNGCMRCVILRGVRSAGRLVPKLELKCAFGLRQCASRALLDCCSAGLGISVCSTPPRVVHRYQTDVRTARDRCACRAHLDGFPIPVTLSRFTLLERVHGGADAFTRVTRDLGRRDHRRDRRGRARAGRSGRKRAGARACRAGRRSRRAHRRLAYANSVFVWGDMRDCGSKRVGFAFLLLLLTITAKETA